MFGMLVCVVTKRCNVITVTAPCRELKLGVKHILQPDTRALTDTLPTQSTISLRVPKQPITDVHHTDPLMNRVAAGGGPAESPAVQMFVQINQKSSKNKLQ